MSSKRKTVVHMIGNAHIDPVYMWRIGEGREEVLATYRSALERTEETAGFIFSSGGAVTFRWVQEDEPGLFALIQQRVAEGRWSLVNGWWVEPDCNIPSGESFVRHGLYGQRALQDMFGQRAVTGYNVDSFGHAGSLPQILLGCGLRNYVFFRPMPDQEKDLPGTVFWWESDDGSSVLASRPPLHYLSSEDDLVERIDLTASQVPADIGHVMCFYGVGNHGGGPTRANIASILYAMDRPDGPEVLFGSTDRFFEVVRATGADLPVLHDELQHHARGCYTAVSEVKRHNRKCENALLTAEKFAALAHHFVGTGYPHQRLTHAWENVLLSQFHDILAGTSICEALEDACATYAESERIAGQVLETALSEIEARIDTQGEERALLVFNPQPWAHIAPVQVAVRVTERWNEEIGPHFRPGIVRMTDDHGHAVPCQVTALEYGGLNYVMRFCFLAELPAMGYRRYVFSLPEDAPTWSGAQPQPATTIENEHLRLTFDRQTGWLTSLYDRDNQVELLRDASGVPLVVDDPSDTWGHDVIAFDDVVGRFSAKGDVHLVESGPVRQVMRICGGWGCSTATLEYRLYAHDRQVYVDMTVDWHEQLKMLKLAFSLALQNAQTTSSTPYGSIQRSDDGGEEPCQSWVDVSGLHKGRPYGFALLNDCKYGYDACGGEMRLSILRSPVFAFHEPQMEPGVIYHYADQGKQVIRLVLLPHAGTFADADVARRAEALNAPPIAREASLHPGDWPPSASFLCCSAPNVVLTVFKAAEDGQGLIVRGVETAGRTTAAEVSFGLSPSDTCDAQDGWTVTWRPHEIKTLRLRLGGEPVEANMLEEEARPS